MHFLFFFVHILQVCTNEHQVTLRREERAEEAPHCKAETEGEAMKKWSNLLALSYWQNHYDFRNCIMALISFEDRYSWPGIPG